MSEKKLSIASLITKKTQDNNLIIFNDFENKLDKTKQFNLILTKFNALNSLIVLDSKSKENVDKSARNIPNIKVTDVNHFSAYDLAKFKKLIFTESSVKQLEKKFND